MHLRQCLGGWVEVGVLKMGNVASRAGIEPTSPTFKASVRSLSYCNNAEHLANKESLFCLTILLQHIDFYIISYWTSSIWSLWHISLEETRCRHIGYSFQKAARDLSNPIDHAYLSYLLRFYLLVTSKVIP